jgi:hypothetical protein
MKKLRVDESSVKYRVTGLQPVTLFALSEAGTVGSNPTQGMDVWSLCVCVCVCVCKRFSVFVYR